MKYYFEHDKGNLIARLLRSVDLDLHPNVVEFELEENHDMIDNFIKYKKDGYLIPQDEFKKLYPYFGKEKVSDLDKLKEQQERTDKAIQDLILMTLGGGLNG